jgi:cleavage stimulation factor subunit 3
MPPAASHLNSILPPAMYFHGPFVGVDKLLDVFQRLQLPDSPATANGEGADVSQFELAKSVHWIVNESDHNQNNHQTHQNNHFGRGAKGKGVKRKGAGMNQDSDDEDSSIQAPLNDIFRVRQQKRVK